MPFKNIKIILIIFLVISSSKQERKNNALNVTVIYKRDKGCNKKIETNFNKKIRTYL